MKLEKPKSAIFTQLREDMSMFSGFKSLVFFESSIRKSFCKEVERGKKSWKEKKRPVYNVMAVAKRKT